MLFSDNRYFANSHDWQEFAESGGAIDRSVADVALSAAVWLASGPPPTHSKPFSDMYAASMAAARNAMAPPSTQGHLARPRSGSISSRDFGTSEGSAMCCFERS